jgi:hypothetical protein
MAGGPFTHRDGKSRTHIPPTPSLVFVIRICQLLLAIIVMGLTAYAASEIQKASGGYSIKTWLGAKGYHMSWFAFAWTLIYIAWLLLALSVFPVAYNCWVHL